MRAVGLLIDVRVRPGNAERFLVATRLYRQATYRVAPPTRFEIFKDHDRPDVFVIHQIFRDQSVLEAQRNGEHSRRWVEAVTPLLDGEAVVRRVETILGERGAPVRPPPLPARPGLETAAELPRATRARWAAERSGRLRLEVARVELAAATETEWLGGKPDPCIVLGCFALANGRAYCVGRALYRFPADTVPMDLSPDEAVFEVDAPLDDQRLRLCVIVIGFEENGGTDVRSAYQDLGEPSALVLWHTGELEPSPLSVTEYAARAGLDEVQSVELAREGACLGADAADDTWVGAVAAVVDFDGNRPERSVRCRTASPDRKNDWSVTLRLCVGAVTRA